MSRETESTTIDGDRYEMTQLGATAGYRLFHRLFTMLGPTFGKVTDALASDGSIQDVNLSSDAAVAAIEALTHHVTERDLDHVINVLKGETHVGVGGSEKTVPLAGVFEVHFAGRIGTLFRWLAWGLKVQFASFLDAVKDMKPPGGAAVSSAEMSKIQ